MMENPRCIQERDRTQRKEEVEQSKSDKGIDIYKSEPCTGLIKQSEGPLVKKSRKKHCDWIKSSSDTYCPNTKLFKNYMHRKTYDRLKKYIEDETSVSDLPQKCETLVR